MNYFFDTEFLEDGKTIELISIGIVASDGREFYRELWLEDDVMERLYDHEWLMANVVPHLRWQTTESELVTREVLRQEIGEFVTGRPHFWAHCGAYDWVVLNQLYGPMIAHPPKWRFWCGELSQLSIEKGISRESWPKQEGSEHNALEDARWNKQVYDFLGGEP